MKQDKYTPFKDKNLEKQLINIIKANSTPLNPVPTEINPSLTKLNNIKSVIFDIYGTLVISASGDIGSNNPEVESTSFYKALNEAGILIFSGTAGNMGISLYHKEINRIHSEKKSSGINNPEVDIFDVWKTILTQLSDNKLIETNISVHKIYTAAVWFESLVNPVWLMPGFLNTLEKLRNKNILLGIISNAQFYTPLIFPALSGLTLEKLGFNNELTEFSYMNGNSKPSTDMFKKIIVKLDKNHGITPEETVYIGNDMLNDVYSADTTGMNTALFAGDARSLRLRRDKKEVKNLKPDIVLTELNQIPDIFE